jgi:hypothetical protein
MADLRAAGVLFLLTSGAIPARGQEIAFDRPEAWALKYYTAVTTFTGMRAPRARTPGAVEIGIEGGWVPYLDEDQRRVGFEGTSLEDLNKTPFIARPRVLVALPAGIALEAGWIPPVRLNGGRANLFDGAVEMAFVDRPGGSFGLRLYGQIGHAMGDFTCPQEVVDQPSGSAGNPQGCTQRSEDTATLNDAGAAVAGGVRVGLATVHGALGATYNDLQFQVGAYTGGFADNTLLKTHGWTGWVALGADFPVGGHAAISGELFYSPLEVRRPPSSASTNDPLFNVRAMLRWRID